MKYTIDNKREGCGERSAVSADLAQSRDSLLVSTCLDEGAEQEQTP